MGGRARSSFMASWNILANSRAFAAEARDHQVVKFVFLTKENPTQYKL